MSFAKYIDHTLLKPNASVNDIKKLCAEAKYYTFCAVCINGYYVNLAANELRNTTIKTAAVIGFPLGAMSSKTKIYEAQQCIENGADEIDMVLNIGLLKSGYYKIVEDEIKNIKKIIEKNTLKVIFENCYLTDQEKKIACQLSVNAGADFIKTSTGFGTNGATLEDIKLMKGEVKNNVQIKASGGIRDSETAKQYIDLGVSRIGTSSGIAIVTSE
ncbi:deoxyribose-phosphate aldolase [Aquimarina muelleri]|uniref:Deoxyribose-phosphate aldolase n=1 Tax=Aquimarina muelleri TaxID=279356 RepID=A0A918JUV4_9FLAO|nr:deoxyribose-phosphate aldolase [Aquimarina muelleri]MCX2762716.1 deoxyribose-phosphate aldolase [Aquimarina muelleri]GGX18554.1 2-deoxyribose-5-phosphate aldolase [Aquimarina muelleri]